MLINFFSPIGVVGTGLFLGTAHQAYLGKADGSVHVMKNPSA